MKNKKFFFLIPILAFFALPLVIMFLWNQLVPDIFSLKEINYLQALGLWLLSRILLGRFPNGKHKNGPFMKSGKHRKFLNMSEEERRKFREEWKKRSGSCK